MRKLTYILLLLFTGGCVQYDIIPPKELPKDPIITLTPTYEYPVDSSGYYRIDASYDDLFKRLEVWVEINNTPANNTRVEWSSSYEVYLQYNKDNSIVTESDFLNNLQIVNTTSISQDGIAVTHLFIHPKFAGDTIPIEITVNYYSYREQKIKSVNSKTNFIVW